jgi:hypothetical protein
MVSGGGRSNRKQSGKCETGTLHATITVRNMPASM